MASTGLRRIATLLAHASRNGRVDDHGDFVCGTQAGTLTTWLLTKRALLCEGHSFSLKLESWNANGVHLRMSRFPVAAVCRYTGFYFELNVPLEARIKMCRCKAAKGTTSTSPFLLAAPAGNAPRVAYPLPSNAAAR